MRIIGEQGLSSKWQRKVYFKSVLIMIEKENRQINVNTSWFIEFIYYGPRVIAWQWEKEGIPKRPANQSMKIRAVNEDASHIQVRISGVQSRSPTSTILCWYVYEKRTAKRTCRYSIIGNSSDIHWMSYSGGAIYKLVFISQTRNSRSLIHLPTKCHFPGHTGDFHSHNQRGN